MRVSERQSSAIQTMLDTSWLNMAQKLPNRVGKKKHDGHKSLHGLRYMKQDGMRWDDFKIIHTKKCEIPPLVPCILSSRQTATANSHLRWFDLLWSPENDKAAAATTTSIEEDV